MPRRQGRSLVEPARGAEYPAQAVRNQVRRGDHGEGRPQDRPNPVVIHGNVGRAVDTGGGDDGCARPEGARRHHGGVPTPPRGRVLIGRRNDFELPADLRASGETPAGLHDVAHVPGFLPRGDADALLAHCLGGLDWREERLQMFGKEVIAPRLTACHGDPGRSYRYSGVTHACAPWTPELRRAACMTGQRLGAVFNFVVANRYRSGADCIGWHADDERGLGPVIASLSLGAARMFRIRRKGGGGGGRSAGLRLAHGDLVVMWGRFQQDFKHALPRAAGVPEERVNLTLRRIES